MTKAAQDGTSALAAFARDAGRMAEGERFYREELRPIQLGAKGFIGALDRQTALIDGLLAELTRLERLGSGYGAQIEELRESRRQIGELRERADAIRQAVTGSRSLYRPADAVRRIWEDQILPLRRAEAERQFAAMRVQGPMVESKVHRGENCGGLLGEAIVRATQFLRDAATDPVNPLGTMWRWLVQEGPRTSIWLYRHSAGEKWKCLFFRIEITRTVDDLDFLLESYVPFGLTGDPGSYALAESKVYHRPGWRRLDVFTDTYNRSNTLSLNASTTQTAGVSFGVTAGTSDSRQLGRSRSNSFNESHASSVSTTEGHSWFDSHGSSYSGSLISGGSSGTSSGRGHSGNSSLTRGETATIGTAVTTGVNEGVTLGANQSLSLGRNESVAETIGQGFALTDGRTLQVERYSFGIDLGQEAGRHLQQWRMGNPDAARDYDAVIRLFDSLSRNVTEHVQAIVKTGPWPEGRDLGGLMDEIRKLILIEPPPERPSRGRRD